MSILFVLLMFLLVMSITYFRTRSELPAKVQAAAPRPPRMETTYGFQLPEGYCFHPGHTWASKESPESARIGLDNFAANLLGHIDQIDVTGENRWIRQGQKLMTVRSGDAVVDFVSPVEGVITSLNHDALKDPSLITREPYSHGWIAMVKSPELSINQRNLVQGSMVAPWLQNTITRLNGMVGTLAPTMAADGGVPMGGLLSRLEPELRQRITREFFLS